MPAQVFICYAHEDAAWKDRLRRHLQNFVDEDAFELWDDSRLRPGERWEKKINAALEAASVAVVLVSKTALDSDFILQVELPRLRIRNEREDFRVIPLIVDECAWNSIGWLEKLEARPKSGALASMEKAARNDVLYEVAREIAGLIQPAEPVPPPQQPAVAGPPAPPPPAARSARVAPVQFLHNQTWGGILTMDCLVSAQVYGALGASGQIVVSFWFPNQMPVLAAPQEFTYRNVSGGVATCTETIRIPSDPFDSGVVVARIPYHALNLVRTGAPIMLHAVAHVMIDNQEIARSTPAPFTVFG